MDAAFEELGDALAVVLRRLGAVEPVGEVGVAHHRHLVGDLEPGVLEEAVPLGDAVVADVARVAEPVGLLGALARERVVLDHDAVARDARHLLERGERVGEVVRGDAACDDVEARVGEREMVGRRDRRRAACPARRRRSRPRPRPRAAAARRGRRRLRRRAPSRLQPARTTRRRDRGRRRTRASGSCGTPRRARSKSRSLASSTARRAPSSIVASGWMFSRRRPRGSAALRQRSSRRAGRRSDTLISSGRAPRGSRARPRRSA